MIPLSGFKIPNTFVGLWKTVPLGILCETWVAVPHHVIKIYWFCRVGWPNKIVHFEVLSANYVSQQYSF